MTWISVTGILHLINKTPFDLYSKNQATCEIATYGSEFMAARTRTERITDICNTLSYLGAPLREKCFIFGDNESVVDSASIPHAKVYKRYIARSFHRVRKSIAVGVMLFRFLVGKDNLVDILSKHWGNQQVWKILQPILFWRGDTMYLISNQDNDKV